MSSATERNSQDGRTALSAADAAAAARALGFAVFELDYAGDRLLWSDNAHEVLGLQPFEVPRSMRAFARLLSPGSRSRRLPATPPLTLAQGRSGPDYMIRYELLPRGGRAFGVEIEEQGRWTGAEGEAARGCVGFVRALERPLAASGCDQPRLAAFASPFLARDELLSILDGAIVNLVRNRLQPAVFLLIAVDDIARINAKFGYETGDRVIAVVAERIGRRMRQGDALGHMSGHKFGAILFNCDETALTVAATRFRDAISETPVEAGGAAIRCQVSIGAVLLPRHATDVSTAVIRAEEALADARTDSERRLSLYQPSSLREAERRRNVEIADELRKGLQEQRFILAYQPVVDAQSRQLLSYEALSRLVLADGRVVSGGPYVGVAETLGLIRRLDLRALTQVLVDLADCPELRLSVNASVESLLDPNWLAHLLEVARTTPQTLRRLTIEITETAAMACVDDLVHLATTLRDIGCRIAIDDFGSGHTSFKVLRELRPDWLKIDGAFIRNLAQDPDALVFVKTLATLAGHFGIRTIAEFVQDEASARRLAEIGITALQGRHVGEPRLRLSPAARAALSARPASETREEDGYPSFAGFLEGPIAVERA